MRLLLLMLFLGIPVTTLAQQTDVAIYGLANVAMQSTNDDFNPPYLSEPIGGFAPGLAAGVSTIHNSGVAQIEFSTSWFEKEQTGRVIGGGCERIPSSFECRSTTRLHDSMLTGLFGFAHRDEDSGVRVAAMGGISYVLDSPTANGVSIDSNADTGSRFGLGGGVDVLFSSHDRVSFSIGVRYLFINRTEADEEIGIGPHSIRAGAGIRFKLN
jgi:hypothetical protein